MAESKPNAVRIAESYCAPRKLFFRLHSYPCREAVDGVTVAGMLGVPVENVFKTLVTQGKSGAYFVFVVPVAEELDLKKAAKSVGEKAVSMIPVKDINKVTGYVRGGCSPIGMKKQLVTRIDESAILCDNIFVSAGRIGQQLELSAEHIIAITGAQYADLTAEHA